MIKMADLIKKQNDMIRKSTGMNIVKKEQLSEAISFSKEEMAKLHNDGSLEKDGNTYVYQEGGPGSGPHGNGDDEENPFDREPSDDEMADIEREFESVNEVNFEKIKLPSQVNRFLGKFVQSMKDANLNRVKRSAILYKVIHASGMNVSQLSSDIQKIKKELKWL